MRALLLIDIQSGFDDLNYWGGGRNNPDAEANARKILDHFRVKKWPVYHVQHCSTNPDSPLRPGHPGNRINPIVEPVGDEKVVKKEVNSAFIGTDLEGQLKNNGIDEVVIVGLTTDHCVSTTTRMAGNLGFNTTVISDATATFNKIGIDGEKYDAELIHRTALASLKDEFAEVLDTETIIKVLS